MDSDRPKDIPYGYCWCGCGEKTRISPYHSTYWGYVKGEPRRFLPGHGRRGCTVRTWTVDPDTDCWNWDGSIQTAGYGRVHIKEQERLLAHRWVYEQQRGPIPQGHDLHHTCHNKLCVNPDHLEPMTRSEHRKLHNELDHAVICPDDSAEVQS